jgi:hypothetical protein
VPRWFRVYPFLACIWSPLHLAASNAGEWVQLSDLGKPLTISVVATVIAWIVAALLTRDPDKRAFLAFLGVLAFIGAGSLMDTLALLLPAVDTAVSAVLLLTALGVCAAVGIVGSRRSFASASRFLGLTTAFLLTFAVLRLVAGYRGQGTVAHAATPAPPALRLPGTRPSIYLIVLDKYQGSASLRSYYGFDNTPFEQQLRDRGFVLPLHPLANYTHTRQALSALLNWEYLDSLVGVVGEDATDWTPVYRRVEDNRTIALLKSLGYEIIFFPNNYEPFRANRHADLQLPDPSAVRPELETAWLGSTLLVPLTSLGCKVVACVPAPWLPESPALTDWKFAQLGRLAGSSRPRFVLAHFLVPHEPYVYRADCRHVPPSEVWPDPAASRAAYLEQIGCVNQKLLAVVDAILRTEHSPPVILLQSDHGHGHIPGDDLPLERASEAMIRARVDIFAAYYVPDAQDTLFYEGMTPVNLLPRVFNHLFGTRFPRQPDRSIWVIGKAPYRMTPVPAKILAAPE